MGEAVGLWSSNFGDLIRIMAVFVLPVVVLQWLLGMLMVEEFAERGGRTMMMFQDEAALDRYELLSRLLSIVLSFATWVAQGACVGLLWPRSQSREVKWTEAVRVGLAAAGTLLLVAVLVGVFAVIGLLLFILPGIYVVVRLALAPAVVIAEKERALGALGRSGTLIRGRWWPTLGRLLLIGLIGLVLTFGILLCLVLASRLVSALGPPAVSFAWDTISSSLYTIILSPLGVSAIVAIYRDLSWCKGRPGLLS